MAETSRLKYEIAKKLYNERKQLEEGIQIDKYPFELADEFDDFYETLTTMQKAIFFLMEMGFTKEWIQNHFEISRQAMNMHLINIRQKLVEFLAKRRDDL